MALKDLFKPIDAPESSQVDIGDDIITQLEVDLANGLAAAAMVRIVEARVTVEELEAKRLPIPPGVSELAESDLIEVERKRRRVNRIPRIG